MRFTVQNHYLKCLGRISTKAVHFGIWALQSSSIGKSFLLDKYQTLFTKSGAPRFSVQLVPNLRSSLLKMRARETPLFTSKNDLEIYQESLPATEKTTLIVHNSTTLLSKNADTQGGRRCLAQIVSQDCSSFLLLHCVRCSREMVQVAG